MCEGVIFTRQQSTVGGSQKQLTRCFRGLDVASQKHQKVVELEEWVIHAPGPSTTYGYSTKEKRDFTKLSLRGRSFGPLM